MSWSDDKKLLSNADAIGWNSLKKKRSVNTRYMALELNVSSAYEKVKGVFWGIYGLNGL